MQFPSYLPMVCYALMGLGVLTFAFMLFKDRERAWLAYLAGFFYFTSIALGGVFFLAIKSAAKAGWVVNVRRFPEALSSFLPFALVAGIIYLVGAHDVYEWLKPEVVSHDHILQHKASYLNYPFFIVRMILFLGAWIFFQRKLVGFSLEQDRSGDESLTNKAVGYAIAFILVFAISYSLFSVDLLMSLQPHWFSTIFGVYTFAGLFQSALATMILFVIYGMNTGALKGFVDENHLHDLGKFLFAFTVFWAYIAYSQYMLIWYANLPEETQFFIPRSEGTWAYVSIALILFRFIVPFLALLPRWVKRSPKHLAPIAVLLLIMQYVDLYWLIYPNLDKKQVIFGPQEVLVWAGFGGAFLFAVTKFLSSHPIVPLKDPRQHESMHHHVVY